MQLGLVIAAFLSVTTTAFAQHQGHAPSASKADSVAVGAFDVRVYGAFREFVQKQDFSPRIDLPAVRATGATEAVGALSGLRGEVTFVDGKPIVSYGGCADCILKHGETAALLGSAKVSEWAQPVLLPTELRGQELDSFILQQAKTAGIDTAAPFPVRLTGELSKVEMHVLEAPNAGFTGHGSQVHMAKQDNFRHEMLAGFVVGFYAPATLQGTLTHPGEPFHFHWVDEARSRTAHLDAFGMKAGTKLQFPKN